MGSSNSVFRIYVALLVVVLFSNISAFQKNDYQTLLVTVVFRDGDRTPDTPFMYPRDPYVNSTYYPIGIGQLTKNGKKREYALGQLIRRQYDEFLGDTYFPGQVEAISTNANITKASLELVLAGVFRPKGTILQWSPVLNWDPIGYNSLSYEFDQWLTVSEYFCPKYTKLYLEYLQSPEGQAIIKKNYLLYQYLNSNTGLNVTEPVQAWEIYSYLLSQEELGLQLPLWSTAVFPDMLQVASVDALQSLIATPELRRLSGGFTLKKIIENMEAKTENVLRPAKTKLILYSAHENNILYLSGVLNQPVDQLVPYGAFYIIQLVETSGEYYVKIFQNDYTTREPIEVSVPGCDVLCPLAQFSEILSEYIPDHDYECEDDIEYKGRYEQRRSFYLGKIRHEDVVRRYVKLAALWDKFDQQRSDLF